MYLGKFYLKNIFVKKIAKDIVEDIFGTLPYIKTCYMGLNNNLISNKYKIFLGIIVSKLFVIYPTIAQRICLM